MQSKEIVKALRRGLFSNELLQIAADKIEELENKSTEWINVKDRLPEEDTRVLVVVSDEKFKCVKQYVPKLDTDRIFDGRWVRWSKHVTYWQPLPEPPKPQ